MNKCAKNYKTLECLLLGVFCTSILFILNNRLKEENEIKEIKEIKEINEIKEIKEDIVKEQEGPKKEKNAFERLDDIEKAQNNLDKDIEKRKNDIRELKKDYKAFGEFYKESDKRLDKLEKDLVNYKKTNYFIN